MKNLSWRVPVLTVFAMWLVACDSHQEPTTDVEWQAFCEAPDSFERIKAITDEAKRQRVGSTCARAPWKKFVPSKPQAF